jgi:hypothetical protein
VGEQRSDRRHGEDRRRSHHEVSGGVDEAGRAAGQQDPAHHRPVGPPGQQPVGDERAGDDAHTPGAEQEPGPPVPGMEGAGGQQGEHPQRPAAEPEPELGAEERGHERVGAGVADRLDRVGQRTQPAAGPLRRGHLGRAAKAGDEDGGEEEAGAVGHEGGLPPEGQREEPAHGGADGQHRSPRARHHHRGQLEVLGIDQVGQRRLRRGSEERAQTGDEALSHEREGHRAVRGDEEQPGRHRLQERHADHQRAAVPTVGGWPGQRAEEEGRQRLDDEHGRRRDVGPRPVDDEAEHGDGGEPVATEGDDLGQEESPEVAVASEQLDH